MHRRWWFFVIWLLGVSFIILMADLGRLSWLTEILQRNPGLDKICHFSLIGTLAFLFNQALGCRKLRGLMLGSLIIGTILTLEEISQRWVPGRNFDYGDMVANLAGCITADLLSRRALRKA